MKLLLESGANEGAVHILEDDRLVTDWSDFRLDLAAMSVLCENRSRG